tara:strand:- start:1439 stop:2611 length:1173 start_codon:yes stop_codon:yes gene_type:complete
MSDFGITPEGFSRKRLDQLLSELDDEMKAIFGDNFNVSPESPDGQINGVVSESNANLWEIANESYDAFNPSAATGVSLSNLVQLNGITRLSATSSNVELTITGSNNTFIPKGSLISTSDASDQFSTDTDITIGLSGTVLVQASSILEAPVSALAGTITNIDTPITGWTTVTNIIDATLGTLEETDVELRSRRERSVAKTSQSVIDAIFAAVANVDGVTQTTVLENDTNSVDGNGLPPHSFNVIVSGGDDTDIGDQIWLKKPAGITSHGSENIVIQDSQGLDHTMRFDRPTLVPIHVEVGLTTNPEYPTKGDDLVKQAIVDYANGNLVEGRGFFLGDDVVYTRLYTPINSVQGHEITTLKISKIDPPTGVINIPITAGELAEFTIANIDII